MEIVYYARSDNVCSARENIPRFSLDVGVSIAARLGPLVLIIFAMDLSSMEINVNTIKRRPCVRVCVV